MSIPRRPECGIFVKSGGQGVNRTPDTRIFSPLLYQLSYLATGRARIRLAARRSRQESGLSPIDATYQ